MHECKIKNCDCYEREVESSMREHQLDCGWVEMHGFSKFRSGDLKNEKEAACKNWGECVSCKGNYVCYGPTDGKKLKVLGT